MDYLRRTNTEINENSKFSIGEDIKKKETSTQMEIKKNKIEYQSNINLIKRIIKQYNIIINNKEQLIDLYIKYNKANRYSYIITYNNKTYAIIMNKKQFKQFAMQFGRYSKNRNNIRFDITDNTIYKWLGI